MLKWALKAALVGHIFAWVSLLLLVFWTGFYSGQSSTAVVVNGTGSQGQTTLTLVGSEATTESLSASVVEINGFRIIPVLAIPVALTAAAAMAVVLLPTRPLFGMSLAWTCTISIVLFSLLGAFSIGLFYFPAAMALILASLLASIGEMNKGSATPPA
tara:strand:- start:458 stop:931 length:474 start_codon:yes stop_codon:yes gene_type:complete